ncbi:MAG: hypothetical protein SGPRY_007550 [Prymnesium sp.]
MGSVVHARQHPNLTITFTLLYISLVESVVHARQHPRPKPTLYLLAESNVHASQHPYLLTFPYGVRYVHVRQHPNPHPPLQFFPVFVTSVKHDQEEVQIAALRALFDMLLTHTPSPFFERASSFSPSPDKPLEPVEDEFAKEVGGVVMPLLMGSNGPLRRLAAFGVCKLLHVGALQSTSLISRLLLIHFQEGDDNHDGSSLKQLLALFLTSGCDKRALCSALLPSIRTALTSPPGSPDASVRVEGMIGLVVDVCRPEEGEDASLHEELALVS